MKLQFFTLLALAGAALALPQGEELSTLTPVISPTSDDGNIETFPTLISGTETISVPSDLPSELPPTTSPGSVPSVSATVSTGNSTSSATASRVTSLISLTPSASKAPVTTGANSTTTTGAASSVRAASVPLAVVAGILGASQMFF